MPAKFIFLFAHLVDRQKGLSIGFRNNFLMLVSNFWETTFVCFSNLRYSIDPFSSISTAHAAVARLRRAQRAQGCSGNVARAPTFSLESFIHRPKRRKQEKGQGIAYMSATLPKRDSCSLRQVTAKGAEQVRYGMDLIRPLLMEPSASIIPLRPPPPVFSFCGKHCSCFLFVDQEKIGMSGATEV